MKVGRQCFYTTGIVWPGHTFMAGRIQSSMLLLLVHHSFAFIGLGFDYI